MDIATVKYSELSEKELIFLLHEGHEGALRSLYDIHVKKLHYFILRTAKSRQLAEDVVQDVFIKIWETRVLIDPELPFRTYLYTIAKRHLLNLLKRLQHESGILNEIRKYVDPSENTTELQVEYSESNVMLTEAISKLPPQCKEVFIRCKMQGLSYKQVAAELAITEGTVNSQMVKALRSIREYITFKNAALALLVFLSNLLD
ncbi:RNA polymerase sigma-70 factor (ECF subfamily) [Arcticibacter tournemirensis]|uniref:RNA polymerase sigma factor n=1 Tax=Arcticibacter tournemirensis TaxID=699437 RepID=A0A5M9GUB2_9SPHI|nr:RNA polymerase sigma-70 factor [Arcticibacter tournemirensis]KAA8477177.1 RNA polymerase sigma-70 factor [Arcticibacter tournemirensis]TQM51174.1 RNA polymerase sigma-70 factor (ECF subfamily) [Arcticibacter tournemirensis]